MAAASKKKKIGVNLVIHIVLLILAVICLAPIALVFINSFKENAEIVANPLSIPVVLHRIIFRRGRQATSPWDLSTVSN